MIEIFKKLWKWCEGDKISLWKKSYQGDMILVRNIFNVEVMQRVGRTLD